MRPYLVPPWTNSCQIWCVRGFHHVLLKYCHENAEMQKRKFDDVTLQYSILLLVMALSAMWRVFGFLPTTHDRGNKSKQNASITFAHCKAFRACSSLRLDHSTHASDESQLYWLQEKSGYPQMKLHAGIKMAQVLGSPICSCGLHL